MISCLKPKKVIFCVILLSVISITTLVLINPFNRNQSTTTFVDVVENDASTTVDGIEWTNADSPGNKLEILLYWSGVPMNLSRFQRAFAECEPWCTLTNDYSRMGQADVVIFVHRLMDHFRRRRYDQRGNRHQIFVDLDFEPPTMFVDTRRRIPPNFFNATASYSHDADYVLSYGQVRKVETPMSAHDYKTQKMLEIRNRTKVAFFMTKHCVTHSRRETLVQEIQRFIPVDVFGKCYNKTYCDDECEKENNKVYRFYLAFENSICDNYVTEKFYRYNGDLVPIVMRKKDYENIGPAGSYIALDEFDSIESFATHINSLMGDDEAYYNYLEPMRLFNRTTRKHHHYPCDICKQIVAGKPALNRHPLSWYTREKQCDPYFINNFMFV